MTDRPEADSDEFLEVMRDTRSRYVAGFADQLDHLRSLASGEPSPEQLQALRTVAHRMAGLSGTLGFRTVGAQASELESLVESALAFSNFDSAQTLGVIHTLGDAFTRDLAAPPSWAAPAPAAAAKARVLLVEDDEDQRAIVRSYLEKAGFAVSGVSTGDAAVEAAKRERPSLILLDVHLPGMDGYSVCRTLKADRDTRGIPIVFATTRAAINERLAGLALGADDYLTKPIDMRELLIRVRRLTEARPQAATDALAEGPVRRYEDWLDAARAALEAGSAAIAMVRAPEGQHPRVAAALSENLRRRDIIAAYDRTHLLVLMPDVDAARAVDTIGSALAGLQAHGVHAGVAAGTSVPAADLIAEADDALASARHTGDLVSLRAASPARRETSAARTVLLADDDPDVMRIVDAHMRSLGFTTTVVFDGQAAIAALASAPDVVVLDLMMPKMTGFEVLQQMAGMDGPRPKAIVLSARGREDDVTRAFDLGADDYMVKPFSPQELGARIGRLLR